ncbi:MAG: 3-isopropylmalate dehydrogenase [Gammaproteobacteria bacterium]
MKARIAVLPGDGIGPEVTAEAVRVLRAVAERYHHDFTLDELPFGGVAIDQFNDGLPAHTLSGCLAADGVLLGAIGGPKWGPTAPIRPEPALLRLRSELGVYANLRPVAVQSSLINASPIKPEYLEGVDLLFVRELTGGIYFGKKSKQDDRAVDECAYSVKEIERITRVAGRLAKSRRGRITQVDKSNVLETSRLWRAVSERVIRDEFEGVSIEHMFVDAAAMHLIRNPKSFDVILTENLFGDILTDEAAMLAGSLGVLPSAALGDQRRGLYEPIHGSAPDIAGRGIANPCGTILSAALLLRHSLELENEAKAIETAVARALDRGARTADIATPGVAALSTRSMGDAVLRAL